MERESGEGWMEKGKRGKGEKRKEEEGRKRGEKRREDGDRLSRRRDCVLMYGWHSDDNRDKLLY